MNPTIVYHLGHARLADMHRQAQRDGLARVARQVRRPAHAVASRPAALTRWAHRVSRVSVP
jgi:hypothetical protein